MEEEVYIQDLHMGDEKTFHRIFEMFHSRLCFFAHEILGGNVDTEDIVQDAFVNLWQKRTDFDSIQSVKSFLYIVVKNKCFNITKHAKVVNKSADALSNDSTEEDLSIYFIEAEILDQLSLALKKLPAGCQNVLHLGFFEKMKNKDIANHLQVSVNTVKTQKKRALHLLRGLLKSAPAWFSFFL